MTLAPQQIGDKGQRYEIRCVGYPKPGENVIGWSNDTTGAARMGLAILKAPSAESVYIFDREANAIVGKSLVLE